MSEVCKQLAVLGLSSLLEETPQKPLSVLVEENIVEVLAQMRKNAVGDLRLRNVEELVDYALWEE